MAHNLQSEHGRDKSSDEFGSPIRRTVDHVHNHETATGPTGYAATTAGGHGFPIQHSDVVSSSSSSEDDGNGGRRKKNVAGGTVDDKTTSVDIEPHGATTTLYGGQEQEKGMMDKIIETLKSIIHRLFYN